MSIMFGHEAPKDTGLFENCFVEYLPLVINNGEPSKTLQRPKTGKSKVIIKVTSYPELIVPQTLKVHPNNLLEKYFHGAPKANEGFPELYFRVTDGITDKPLEICAACKQREKEINIITCAEKGHHIVLKESSGQWKFIKIPVQFHCLPSCHGLSHFEVEMYIFTPQTNSSGKNICFWGKHEVWTRFEWNKRHERSKPESKNKPVTNPSTATLPPNAFGVPSEIFHPTASSQSMVLPGISNVAPTTIPPVDFSNITPAMEDICLPTVPVDSLFPTDPLGALHVAENIAKRKPQEDNENILPSTWEVSDMALQETLNKIKQNVSELSKLVTGSPTRDYKKRRLESLAKDYSHLVEDIQMVELKGVKKEIRIYFDHIKPHVLIFYAFRNGFIDLGMDLGKLYNTSLDVNQKTTTGYTLLHVVVLNGDYKTVEFCLNQAADTNIRNHMQQTPLHLAYMHGNPQIIKLLESQPNIDTEAVDIFGYKPLCYKNNCEVRPVPDIAFSLRVKLPDYHQTFPFDIWYASRIGWLEGVKLYIESISCPVDVKNAIGETPLMCACEYERLEVVEYLVSVGANVNNRNIFDSTPLHYAFAGGDEKVIRYLQEKGADLNLRNHWGRLPKQYFLGQQAARINGRGLDVLKAESIVKHSSSPVK